MTQEEKAMAYDKALSRAKEMVITMTDWGCVAKVDDILHIFPELKENEDEKIMRNIVEAVEFHKDFTQSRKEEIFAWLKKQCKHDNVEWSEDDDEKFRDVIRLVEQGAPTQPIRDHYINWLKSLKDRVQPKQNQEWSNEDEEHLNSVLKRLEGMCKNGATFTQTRFAVSEDKYWLKSLRNQSNWKPSDEQLRPLGYAIDYFKKKKNDTTYLESLYNDLKNLRS